VIFSTPAIAEDSLTTEEDSSIIEEVTTPQVQTYPDGMGQDQQGAWAVLDDNGNVTNLIVCTPAVCGSGTFGGNHVVFQSNANSDGNVVGNPETTYNPNNNTWVATRPSGAVYEVSKDYPGTYGYTPENYLSCIENCESDEFVEDSPVSEQPADIPLDTEIVTQSEEGSGDQSLNVTARILGSQNVVFKSGHFENIDYLNIVTTKKVKKKIWKVSWRQKTNGQSVIKIKIPKQFSLWNVSVFSGNSLLHKVRVAKDNDILKISTLPKNI
jgi:hypothetical protein